MSGVSLVARRGGPKWALGAAAWTCLLIIVVAVLDALSPSFQETGHSRLLPFLGALLVMCTLTAIMLWLADSRQLRWALPAAWTCVALACAECMVMALSVGLFLIPVVVLLIGGAVRRGQPVPGT
ncbi:MAG: hypothetical protein WA976_10435 [Candidatus Dormiibacterota bacterium]